MMTAVKARRERRSLDGTTEGWGRRRSVLPLHHSVASLPTAAAVSAPLFCNPTGSSLAGGLEQRSAIFLLERGDCCCPRICLYDWRRKVVLFEDGAGEAAGKCRCLCGSSSEKVGRRELKFCGEGEKRAAEGVQVMASGLGQIKNSQSRLSKMSKKSNERARERRRRKATLICRRCCADCR